MTEEKEKFEKFRKFVDMIKGRRSIKERVAVLSNPDNPKTMSILSPQQCEFVATASFLNTVPEWGGIFEGLETLAKEIMGVSPSKRGEGREQVIRYVGAISEAKILTKFGLVRGEEKGEEKSE